MDIFRTQRLAWFALGLLVLATSLGVATFTLEWSDVRAKAIDVVADRTSGEIRAFDATLASTSVALDATLALFEVAAPISRADFATFVRHELDGNPAIRAVEWIPAVSAAERAAYEASARADGFVDFAINERSANGDVMPAAERDVYYPVFFVEPYAGNELALGFDLGSNPERLAALEQARDTGEFVVTQRVRLVQETREEFGFLGFLANYGPGLAPTTIEERRERLEGFVLGVFRASEFLGRADLAADLAVRVALVDVSAPVAEQLLYAERPLAEFASLPSAFVHDEVHLFGGREWRFLVMPSEAPPTWWNRWEPWTAAVGMFLLVALAGGLVGALMRQNATITIAVNERTLELRAADVKLQQALQEHQAILAVAGVGIIAIDAAGVVTSVNPAGAEILGLDDPSDLVGRNVDSESPNYSFPRYGDERSDRWTVAEALRTGKTVESELTYGLERDGVRMPLESIASPLVDAEGRIFGAVSVFRDITDRLRMDRAKSEFLAMTGHELRTPVTAIHAALTLVVSGALGKLPEELRPSLTVAAANSDRLVKLVNDILTLQRMALDRAELNLTRVQSLDVLSDVAGLNARAARDASIDIRLYGSGFMADLDEERMVQAISNLVQNAIKFSPEGSAVDLSAYEDEGRGVFEIVDEGNGIPVDRLDDIFSRFEQVDSSDTRMFGGVGLGLAITKAIVDRHGGEVWVARTGATGTTFKVSVPLPGAQLS